MTGSDAALDAARLLATAGVAEDPSFYGPFTQARERVVLTVPQLIQAAWRANDADAFARVFTGDGSLLMRDDQLTGREEIHAYMSRGFREGFRGARVTGRPLAVRFLREDVAVVVTQGGIVLDGDGGLAPEREIRATWVIVAQEDRWRLLSHHSCPIHAITRDQRTEVRGSTMSSEAAKLVAQAKEWAGHYGDYSNGPEGAVLTVPLRIRAAWDRNDADAFAEVFTENGSMLAGDRQMTGREEIRSYMAEAFAGPYRGSRLTETPLDVRLLTDDVAIAITQGGAVPADREELEPAQEARTVWVTTRQGGDWRLLSYQTSPVKG